MRTEQRHSNKKKNRFLYPMLMLKMFVGIGLKADAVISLYNHCSYVQSVMFDFMLPFLSIKKCTEYGQICYIIFLLSGVIFIISH